MNHRERTYPIRGSGRGPMQKESTCARKWFLSGLLVLMLLLTGCGTLRTGTGGTKNANLSPTNEINTAETGPATSVKNVQTTASAGTSEVARTTTPADASEVSQEATPTASSDDAQSSATAATPAESAEPSVSGTATSTTADDSNPPDNSNPPADSNLPADSSPPDSGILVKSGNELSSEEKQKLLEELEKELDALFTEINDVSAEEEMEAQN